MVPQQLCSLGKPGDRLARFLVTDRLQLILVEPDSRKAGWAIVRFVGLLQDTTINGDSTDSKVLHVVVEGQPSRIKVRILTGKKNQKITSVSEKTSGFNCKVHIR